MTKSQFFYMTMYCTVIYHMVLVMFFYFTLYAYISLEHSIVNNLIPKWMTLHENWGEKTVKSINIGVWLWAHGQHATYLVVCCGWSTGPCKVISLISYMWPHLWHDTVNINEQPLLYHQAWCLFTSYSFSPKWFYLQNIKTTKEKPCLYAEYNYDFFSLVLHIQYCNILCFYIDVKCVTCVFLLNTLNCWDRTYH